MRTAIIYSGNARTVCHLWENHRWYLRHLGTPDVFCSVAADAQANDMNALRRAWPQSRFEMETVIQPEIEEPKEETMFRSGYPRSSSKQGVLKQLWSLERAWNFLCERSSPDNYDVIVRCRPDIAFVRLNLRHLATQASPDLCLVSWVERWAGINDRFAVLGPRAAAAYFTTFSQWQKIWDMGGPLHPEQLVMESLHMAGITPDDSLQAEFMTVRLPSAEHPKGGYLAINPSIIDLADYARGRFIPRVPPWNTLGNVLP